MNNHIKLLTANEACEEAIEFAAQYSTMVETIANCTEPEWLRWALQLLPAKERMWHTCYIVRNTPTSTGTVWDLLTDERSRTAIETAERWVDGLATDEELKIAENAARPTRPALDALNAASDAVNEWQAAYIKTIDWSFCDAEQ